MEKRLSFIGILVVLYLLPITAILIYSHGTIPLDQRWQMLTLGLSTSMAGVLCITLLTRRWCIFDEAYLPEGASDGRKLLFLQGEMTELSTNLEKTQEHTTSLKKELSKEQELLTKTLEEKKRLLSDFEELEYSYENLQTETEEKLRCKERLVEEYLQTIADQREVIEKRQRQVNTFENKITDLQYELRMLLDLSKCSSLSEEETNTPPEEKEEPADTLRAFEDQLTQTVRPPTQFSVGGQDIKDQLKRCIDMAQKVTGARHLNDPTVRYQKLSAEGYSLDLRRLCDSLSTESQNTVMLYSRKDDKLIFCNEQIKELLGWSPEKFVQNFNHLIVDGYELWHEALRKLVPSELSNVELTIESRSGEHLPVKCHLGMIPTGMFRMHVIVVVTPCTA